MAELRRDFRVIYGCCYDDVRPAEALDLIAYLGYGSAYKAAVSGDLDWLWTVEEHKLTDLMDGIMAMMQLYATRSTEGAPKSRRPGDAARTERAKAKSRAVRSRIESTQWQAVEPGEHADGG